MAAADATTDDSLYPIAVLIDELRNEDVQVISLKSFMMKHNLNETTSLNIGLSFIFVIHSSVRSIRCYNIILPSIGI